MRNKFMSAAGLGALAIATTGTAHAQVVPSTQDDIIVTAERANRTLRETASSVAVSTSEDLERKSGVYSTNDLLDRIPNILSIEPGNDLPAVRGIDGTGPGGGAGLLRRCQAKAQLSGRWAHAERKRGDFRRHQSLGC
jgi:outer membrane receptor protein involved in Fe transport